MDNKKLLFITVIFLGIIPIVSPGKEKNITQVKYLCLPLVKSETKDTNPKILDRYGIPFREEKLPFKPDGSARVVVGGKVKRIFLLGMTSTGTPHSWTDLRNYADRFFIGDELGKIRLDYANGSMQVFPLILGESLWWGKIFFDYPEPFLSDSHFRQALGRSLRLYPPAPVADGNYLAVIVPKDGIIKDIVVENSRAKVGVPLIAGITVEPAPGEKIADGIALAHGSLSPDFAKFAAEKPLCPKGADRGNIPVHLENLKQAFYQSDDNIKGHVAITTPREYSGPKVCFQGTVYARILANIFHYNLQDMAGKVDQNGMYHTSTKGAPNWGIYSGFGSYRTNVGMYYGTSWSRDMGRSLHELTELGYMNEGARCADYCLRMANLREEPSNKFQGFTHLPHWSRVANDPRGYPAFENDGHGLITLFLYKIWQRLPDRNEWLRSRWPDVKAAGDWILWQFDHPEISGARNGVLHSTGESAASKNDGYSVYADCICMDALKGLAKMADSIGETSSARQWRDRAEKMRQAIADNYIITDPKYGRVWTLDFAGWPNNNTVMGPLIFDADYHGFAPEDGDQLFHPVNEAAYQRLIDTYKPFGFYGQAMGYGQGFVTQSALLLDRMQDVTTMLDWTAKEIYDPRLGSFIVPEACDIDSTGRFWYRIGDLGNGVQEAEIIKVLRIVVGLDDTQPNRLQFFPRMPYGWNKITVEKYPVLFEHSGKMEKAFIKYKLERKTDRMKLEITSDKELGAVTMRLGPFKKQPGASSVLVNGNHQKITVEQSGDSWWVRFAISVGPNVEKVSKQ